MVKEPRRFEGFSKETFSFLRALAKHRNDRRWFEANRGRYEEFLLEPLRALVWDMGDFMLGIDGQFEITPAVNKTISRIFRDTRFSRDKTLLKKNMWIVFSRPSKDWGGEPGYFFEISGNWYQYGMGFYSASAATMNKFRELIDENEKGFFKAVSFYKKQRRFEIYGESYKRSKAEGKHEEIRQWYDLRNLCFICRRDLERKLYSRRLVDDLKRDFGMLGPVYEFLRRARDGAK